MGRIGKVPGAAYSYQFHSQLSATLYPKVQNCTPRYRVSRPAVRYLVRPGTELYAKVQSFTASCPLACKPRYSFTATCPLPCMPRYRVVHQITVVRQGTEFHSQLSATLYRKVQSFTAKLSPTLHAKVQSCTPRYRVSQPAVRYLVRQGTELYTKVQSFTASCPLLCTPRYKISQN